MRAVVAVAVESPGASDPHVFVNATGPRDIRPTWVAIDYEAGCSG